MSEGVSIKKFFDFSPTAMGKVSSIGFKLLVILLIVYTLYRAWFMPKQTQTQQISIKKGGQATIIQQQERKKTLIPFIEGGIEKNSAVDLDTYIRAGVRFEW